LVANQRAKQLPCWICRQPINYEAKANSSDAFEVDHIKPVSTHPELAEEPMNLASSHGGCNRSKGARALKPTLGNTSRNW